MKPIHQDETQNRKHAGKWLVGLTGGIGSGKTTVAECFQDRGI
ncbi:MAG: dephospho-CoA kinase, partial [Betaproteobacteria bacterium]|nr:dephospho-CoA kinase [Betaproteobacteria bacterium]